MKRLFDHIDLRVRSLAEAKPFYSAFLPAIGFPDFCETSIGIAYDARRDHPKPEFIGLIEDPDHVPNSTRLAFWADTKDEVDRIAEVVIAAGGRNIEGPMFCHRSLENQPARVGSKPATLRGVMDQAG